MGKITDTIIAQTAATIKPVAIYCRVSTEDQEREGTSLDTQRRACLEYCQDHNYSAIHQFTETASGLTLDRPQLNELRGLIRAGEVKVVVIYAIDRFSREATQGVLLRDELERNQVTLESVTEDIDETPLGKAITYLRNTFAQLEAEKIKERTTRGLRARVIDKRLPVTYRPPFGYSWDKENNRLVPDSNYDTAKLIFELSIDGKTYDYIIKELKRRGILSPAGLPEWTKKTISYILRNPLYAGQFYAFRSKVRKPGKRNGTYYGNTSKEYRPTDEWIYLPEIEIENPIITMGQRASLLDQLLKRQNLSQRHAYTNYLLRGMVFCETHRGKQGKPRVYHGQPHKGKWRYACPERKCYASLIDGPELEHFVVLRTAAMFMLLDKGIWDGFTGIAKQREKTTIAIEADIAKIRKEVEKVLGKMAKLEDKHIENKVNENVYTLLKNQYHNQHNSLLAEQDKLLEDIAMINKHHNISKSAKELISGWKGGMADMAEMFGTGNREDIPVEMVEMVRKLLELVNCEIHIYPVDAEGSYIGKWKIKNKSINLEMRYVLPIEDIVPATDDIALPSSGAGLHNKPAYYPIRIQPSELITQLVGGDTDG